MDALPQPRSIGMQKNIAASFVESCGDAALYVPAGDVKVS